MRGRRARVAGTKAGGKKAAVTAIERYGADHFARIGRIGGSRMGTPGGFAWMKENDPEKLAKLSAKGGRISKRKPMKRT